MSAKRLAVVSLSMGAIIAAPSARATGFTHVLRPGRYKIEVIVEDLVSGRQSTVQQVERCLRPRAIADHVIFEMLSQTPASSCPKYEICAGEFRTGFMAHCLDGDRSSAVGMFALESDNFRGRIEVKNGQDVTTNVEVQYGERVGECAPTGQPDQ